MDKSKNSCYNQDQWKNSTSNSLTNDTFNDPKDKMRKQKKSKQSTPVDCGRSQGCDCK